MALFMVLLYWVVAIPTGPIVTRFRPRYKTRPKAKWAIGRVFMSYGRVLKTRPQNRFFVVLSFLF